MRGFMRALVALTATACISISLHAADDVAPEGIAGFSTGDWDLGCAAPEPTCAAFAPSCRGHGCRTCSASCSGEPTCSASDDSAWCTDGVAPHRWLAGVELLVLKPIAANNLAFTTIESDGVTSAANSQTSFDYHVAFSPRVWLEVLGQNDFGFRATYWTADQDTPTLTGTVPENGQGFIVPPIFGTVNLATNTPGSVYQASAHVSAYTIDFEGVKHVPGSVWKVCFSGGVRYAYIEQQYLGLLRDDVDSVAGGIIYNHRLQGVGPTFAISAGQPLSQRVSLFGQARGTVLCGETATYLSAGEDLNNENAFLTTATSTRHDLFSIGEVQVGMQWSPECEHPWKPLVRVAFEGQLWDGPGSAASEGGLFGYYGLNLTLGMAW